MNPEIAIRIDWPWVLGIVGLLIVLAWKGSARFSVLETSMDWVKDKLSEITTTVENLSNPAFGSHSPVNLTEVGKDWLEKSGLRKYVDDHKSGFLKECEGKKSTNPYEIQQHIFKIFDDYEFAPADEDRIKKFAFEKGTTMNIMRRVAAIYFRSIALGEFKMNEEDIDKHDPQKGKTT